MLNTENYASQCTLTFLSWSAPNFGKKFQRRRAVWTSEVGTGHLVRDSTTDSEYAPLFSENKKSLAVQIILDSLQDFSDTC